jgi:hypothetical protein
VKPAATDAEDNKDMRPGRAKQMRVPVIAFGAGASNRERESEEDVGESKQASWRCMIDVSWARVWLRRLRVVLNGYLHLCLTQPQRRTFFFESWALYLSLRIYSTSGRPAQETRHVENRLPRLGF